MELKTVNWRMLMRPGVQKCDAAGLSLNSHKIHHFQENLVYFSNERFRPEKWFDDNNDPVLIFLRRFEQRKVFYGMKAEN